MSPAEREYIETSLARENAAAPQFTGFRGVLRSGTVWRLAVVIGAVTLVLPAALGEYAALSIFLVSMAVGGALAYDGPFWASASRARPAAVVLAVALLLAGLVMLTVRDQRARAAGSVQTAAQATGRRRA